MVAINTFAKNKRRYFLIEVFNFRSYVSKGINIFADHTNNTTIYTIIRKEFQSVVGSTAELSAVNHFSKERSSGTENTVFPRAGCSRTKSIFDF